MANTTFLRKISHSSHQLAVDNIRGSFLGHDILRAHEALANEPQNFSALFEIHGQRTWDENLERLVIETNAIAPTGVRFTLSQTQVQNVMAAPQRALILTAHRQYLELRTELDQLVLSKRAAILRAARIDNVNLRGNAIEQLVTQSGNFHSVEDASRTLQMGTEVKIDIKTKVLTLASSPKGYNIDKTLRVLSNSNTVVAFFLIGVDPGRDLIKTCLVSIFDRTILEATRVQFHWAGRNSRGVTQLAGDLGVLFEPNFLELVDVQRAQRFVERLIDLQPSNASDIGM